MQKRILMTNKSDKNTKGINFFEKSESPYDSEPAYTLWEKVFSKYSIMNPDHFPKIIKNLLKTGQISLKNKQELTERVGLLKPPISKTGHLTKLQKMRSRVRKHENLIKKYMELRLGSSNNVSLMNGDMFPEFILNMETPYLDSFNENIINQAENRLIEGNFYDFCLFLKQNSDGK